MIKIKKRDGRLEKYNVEKIIKAINKAANGDLSDQTKEFLSKEFSEENIIDRLSIILPAPDFDIEVEYIHRLIEKVLSEEGLNQISHSYNMYRTERDRSRQLKTDLMKSIHKIGVETDRDNANVGNNFSSKLLRISSESNKVYNLAKMKKKTARLHENGDLYQHDLDSYNLTTNCLHIPTERLLKNGFNTGYGSIRSPRRIETAAELTCIILQSTQNN